MPDNMSHGQGKPQNGQGKVREFCEGSWLDTLKKSCYLQVPFQYGNKHTSTDFDIQLKILHCNTEIDISVLVKCSLWSYSEINSLYDCHAVQNIILNCTIQCNIVIPKHSFLKVSLTTNNFKYAFNKFRMKHALHILSIFPKSTIYWSMH